MRIFSSALCAIALIAGGVALSAPAEAAPRVVVRGAYPLVAPSYRYGYGYGPGDYTSNPGYIWGNPADRYYDPAGRVPDTRYYGPPAVDMVLARTLTRNNESMLGHMLRCQATYSTYNPATNFYRGSHGVPQVCYR
jgi:hypothetical protein